MIKGNFIGAAALLLSCAAARAAGPVTPPATGGLVGCQSSLNTCNASLSSCGASLNTCTASLNQCQATSSAISRFAGVWLFSPQAPSGTSCAAQNHGGGEFGITNTGRIMISSGGGCNSNNGGNKPLTDIGSVSSTGQVSAGGTDSNCNCTPSGCVTITCNFTVTGTCNMSGTSGSCSLSLSYQDGSNLTATATSVSN